MNFTLNCHRRSRLCLWGRCVWRGRSLQSWGCLLGRKGCFLASNHGRWSRGCGGGSARGKFAESTILTRSHSKCASPSNWWRSPRRDRIPARRPNTFSRIIFLLSITLIVISSIIKSETNNKCLDEKITSPNLILITSILSLLVSLLYIGDKLKVVGYVK